MTELIREPFGSTHDPRQAQGIKTIRNKALPEILALNGKATLINPAYDSVALAASARSFKAFNSMESGQASEA